MFHVKPCQHPPGSLLQACEAQGAHTDCYCLDINHAVSHAEFIAAFYTTPAFKLERLVLELVLGRASTDGEAQQLACGDAESFAIWTVERRTASQILLREFSGRTRSWLMIDPFAGTAAPITRLFFGSAVMPTRRNGSGPPRLGMVFHCLLPFHKLYSQVLLASAKRKLDGRGDGTGRDH